MNKIKSNFSFLELIYKSTLNPKRKIENIVDIQAINGILFRKGDFKISEYIMIGTELFELESIMFK